jgi:SAM-dependent methyltransferase
MSTTNFTSWDERYSSEGFFYGSEPNDFLRAEAQRISAGGSVLCLAEGEGRNAVYLARQGFAVTAVDGSSVGLEKLNQLATEHGVTVATVCADLADFEMGTDKWNAIVSVWCHLPPALRIDVHKRVVAALKPGGLLILESYTPRQLQYKTGGPPVAEMMMTLESLKAELGPLEFLHSADLDRVIHEGRGHEGNSAVVQVVARKLG